MLFRSRGHAIECRIYAEDPDNNFFPSPGKIQSLRISGGPGIRFDEGIYSGWTVPNEYDPMLGKLIAWGADRSEAIARLRRALDEFHAGGIKTNVRLFHRILASRDFQDGAIYTRWLDDFLHHPEKAESDAEKEGDEGSSITEDAAAIAAALWHVMRQEENISAARGDAAQTSPWKLEGRKEQVERNPRRG